MLHSLEWQLVTDVLGQPIGTVFKGPETDMESVVGKYSTLFASRMFKAVVSLRKMIGNNLFGYS